MIREPDQLSLDLRPEPEVRPQVRVSALRPAAQDGAEWRARVLRVAHELARGEGSLTPSRLRERCKTLELSPPHPNHWGSLWAALEAAGFRRGGERTSTTESRNAAREDVWLPPEEATA